MEEIITDKDYIEVMSKIHRLMAKGSKNVSEEELADIRDLALAAQAYEQAKYAVEIGD